MVAGDVSRDLDDLPLLVAPDDGPRGVGSPQFVRSRRQLPGVAADSAFPFVHVILVLEREKGVDFEMSAFLFYFILFYLS